MLRAGDEVAECERHLPQRAPPAPPLGRVWAGEAHAGNATIERKRARADEAHAGNATIKRKRARAGEAHAGNATIKRKRARAGEAHPLDSASAACHAQATTHRAERTPVTIHLYHHPRSRAATVVWMLEECGVEYHLVPVDLMAGAQKSPEHLALNPMGKVPVLVDQGVAFSESAAIGVYLADRYASGR